MASTWDQAWAESWASAWGATACAWGGAWGTSWATTWCGGVEPGPEPEPAIIIVGGDDAWRKRKRRKTQHELFQELEDTVHRLLHPTPEPETVPVENPVPIEARRAIDDLLALAQRQHAFLQRAAALRAELDTLAKFRERHALELEQDEEDALIWMF